MASNYFSADASSGATSTTQIMAGLFNGIKNQSATMLAKTLCMTKATPVTPKLVEAEMNSNEPPSLAVNKTCMVVSFCKSIPTAAVPPATTAGGNSSLKFIDPAELMRSIYHMSKKQMLILLDCRPYTEFNIKHIKVDIRG